MWERYELKERAKEQLSKYYWSFFAVSLVIGIILGGRDFGINFNLNFNFDINSGVNNIDLNNTFGFIPKNFFTLARNMIILIAGISSAVSLVYEVLVKGPLNVGLKNYFVKAKGKKPDFNDSLYGFTGGRYKNIVKTMGYKLLLEFLWSLLFIIPGIIKSYEYRMVPYILTDSPYLNYKDALSLSKRMTDGHKMDIFILDLSFLGWIALGTLCCGVGTIFVDPYIQATNAELYVKLRENAVQSGYCSCDETN